MSNHKTVSTCIAGLLYTAVSIFGQSPTLTPPTSPANILPPLGLSANETAQVNIANSAAPGFNLEGWAVTCDGTMKFYYASGAAIGAATSFTRYIAGQ